MFTENFFDFPWNENKPWTNTNQSMTASSFTGAFR